MLSGLLSNLNPALSFGVRRSLRAKQGPTHKLIEAFALKRTEKFEVRRHSIGNYRSSYSTTEAHTGAILLGSSSQVSVFRNRKMAASSSKATSADIVVDSFISSCGNVSNFGKSAGVYFVNNSPSICRKASMSLRNGNAKSRSAVCSYFVFDFSPKSCNYNPLVGSWFKSYNTSSSKCYSNGAVSDVSHDGSSCDEQLASLAISDDQRPLSDGPLKLLSGSCYLPHPDKEATGGEDAHFICADEQAVGVADGVGGWADVGINAGEYSRELMSNSVNAIQSEPDGLIDPALVLEKAYSRTNAKGSSTACIIMLKDQGLHAINLGDSGFIVVRDGCTIFESPIQQHDFNFTYQLESGNRGDLPSSGQVFTIPVLPGDVVVAGTDGLFDNLYNHEITSIVGNPLATGFSPEVTAQKIAGTDGLFDKLDNPEITSIVGNPLATGFSPEVTAQKIAALARQRALDRNRQTPFSTAAQEAGFTYYGGKLDDITVVVSYITSSNRTLSSS